jgi:GNAT superfamily N-acetyltransferase
MREGGRIGQSVRVLIPGDEGMDAPGVLIRLRSEADLDACEVIARTVHAIDGYPTYMPNDNFRGFISSREALASWVAIEHDEIIGHVALHSGSSSSVMALATSVTGVDAAHIGVIARLLVAPTARRRGTGGLLLQRAVTEAECRGLISILDVVTTYHAAVTLYEALGWTRLGAVTVQFPGSPKIDEFVYRAPTPKGQPS